MRETIHHDKTIGTNSKFTRHRTIVIHTKSEWQVSVKHIVFIWRIHNRSTNRKIGIQGLRKWDRAYLCTSAKKCAYNQANKGY